MNRLRGQRRRRQRSSSVSVDRCGCRLRSDEWVSSSATVWPAAPSTMTDSPVWATAPTVTVAVGRDHRRSDSVAAWTVAASRTPQFRWKVSVAGGVDDSSDLDSVSDSVDSGIDDDRPDPRCCVGDLPATIVLTASASAPPTAQPSSQTDDFSRQPRDSGSTTNSPATAP